MTDPSPSADPRSAHFLMKRRTFVAASAVAGGAVAASGLLQGCAPDNPAENAKSTSVSLQINGESHEVPVDNRTSLLDMLRERVGLTGTKKGCDQGACGACTVLVNGQRVLGCMTLAVMTNGTEVTTIEGLETNGQLHPLQQAFIDDEGFQCGYCTAGQILSGIGCIREGRADNPEQIREAMSGNICRCGAYTNIVTAIARTAQRGGV
jgi:xanthine dehydrogenase YagT iron-sulfur-binding subunit